VRPKGTQGREISYRKVEVFQDLVSLIETAAQVFIDAAHKAIEERDIFTVVLTGGNTVKDLHVLLASPANRRKIAWKKVHFFWGDERQVPPDHTESNFGQARDLFLSRVGVREENVFRIRGELEPQEAVDDYEEKLRENASGNLEWPRFDLVFLSMGSDGHIASIFPGEISEVERCSPVLATTADYQGRPAQRVSMTPLVFNATRQILLLVSGEGKAAVLRKVLCGEGDARDYPVLRIQPKDGEVMWFVDEAAANQLPKDFFIHDQS
jgi:6-phosphogluconolactonase